MEYILQSKSFDWNRIKNSTILVTGGTGLIGSTLINSLVYADIKKNYDIKILALVRNVKKAEKIFSEQLKAEQNLEFVQGSIEEIPEIKENIDYIIHCAGVTKCLDKADFEIGNYWATRHFIETLKRLDMLPVNFIYISSLSIFGPIREKDYSSICETDTPRPNTAYGLSKLHTEEYLKSLTNFPYVIFRPTGVYGPRERHYFLMAKSVQQHVDFAAGFKRQDITFVFVKDLVQAIYLAIEKNVTGRAYFVSDGKVYSSHTFSDLIRKELGDPWMLRFVCPLFLLKAISFVAENVGRILRKTSTLNCDKYRIMKQRNWRCDISPLEKELGYVPEYPLERGVKEIIAWYKKEGWL